MLAPTASAALISATFVRASALVLEASPPPRRLLEAWLIGWLVFAPVPFLVIAFVVPGLLWLTALGLVVPVVIVEGASAREGLARAWRLARADFGHAIGSLFTLAVVVLLSQSVLVFVLRGFGDAADLGRPLPRERRPLAAALRRRGAAVRRPGRARVE